jgi:hypothetical protein
MKPRHIHIFGGSGSGTSSLAARHGHRHLDTGDWLTGLPTTRVVRLEGDRPLRDRVALVERVVETGSALDGPDRRGLPGQ